MAYCQNNKHILAYLQRIKCYNGAVMDLDKQEKRQILRGELWSIMHNGHGALGHAFNFFLVTLIILSVAIIPLEFIASDSGFKTFTFVLEGLIVGFFTTEYFLRIYAAPNRWRYIFSFFGVVDFLSIVPFYAGLFSTEYIRAFHIIRLLKLTEVEAGAKNSGDMHLEKDMGLIAGETVEYIITKTPLSLFFGCITPTIATAFGLAILLIFNVNPIAIAGAVTLFIFALVFLLKAWLDFSYDVIYLTNMRMVFQNQHLVGRSTNQISYQAITNVKPYYPNLIAYIFRFGSLTVDTAAEHPGQISMHMVRKHEKAAHIIMQHCFTSMKNTRHPKA